ncbi:MAG: hypothetical protein HY722_12620 [Planctomycetes bacterium]|nr:hypothetical protein [Planctomycetota bacterium]
MAVKPLEKDCPRILMVEGYSDLTFLAEALQHLRKWQGVFIKHFNGKPDMAGTMEIYVTPQLLVEKSAIGAVVDADQNPNGTVQRFEQVLSATTGQKVIHGAWTSGKPRVGLFVVPEGSSRPGEIESLVWEAWSSDPRNSASKACVEAYRSCMAGLGVAPQSPERGLIGALFAMRADEDPRLGPGTRAHAFQEWSAPPLAPLMRFLDHIDR